MRLFYLPFALAAMLLFCPAVTHANVTPVSDILASQCRQLENAHGPTLEFPNTFYTNLVFQCSTAPGTAPAGIVMKEIEQYGKALAHADAKPGSTCEITTANGGANVLSQGPMIPTEPSAANDVVVSYNAKYACFSPKPTHASYEKPLYAYEPIHSRYEPRHYRPRFIEEASFTPPPRAWVERDEAYNRRHERKAVFRNGRPAHHTHHAQRKTSSHAAKKAEPKVNKVEVKTTTVTKITPAPAPAPVIISPPSMVLRSPSMPAPTSPLPGFVSP